MSTPTNGDVPYSPDYWQGFMDACIKAENYRRLNPTTQDFFDCLMNMKEEAKLMIYLLDKQQMDDESAYSGRL